MCTHYNTSVAILDLIIDVSTLDGVSRFCVSALLHLKLCPERRFGSHHHDGETRLRAVQSE